MPEPWDVNAVQQLHERVRGLQLRIEKNTYAIPHILEQAKSIGAPLGALRQKLDGRPGQAKIDFVQARLLAIQKELRALFAEQLNQLMVDRDCSP